jgi:predicted transcriptional regulator of viral defense system
MITMGSAIDADLLRLRHEFLAMPALVLTAMQAARLLDVRVEHAVEILATLEEEGWLIRSPAGTYRRSEPVYT